MWVLGTAIRIKGQCKREVDLLTRIKLVCECAFRIEILLIRSGSAYEHLNSKQDFHRRRVFDGV